MISREWAAELVERQLLAWWESGDRMFALGGNAPFVVDGLDGSLHRVFPWTCDDFQWADQYREKVRGEVPPRAAGDFGPVDAQRCVDAVAAGAEPDPESLARLPLLERRSAVATLSGPNPEPEGWSVGTGSGVPAKPA